MFKIASISTASSTLDLTSAAAVLLPLADGQNEPTGHTSLPDQILSVAVVSSVNGAAGNLVFVLVDPNETTDVKRQVYEATVTPTAYRANNTGGASGGYICTVQFADLTNKIDLNGHGQKNRSCSAAGVLGADKSSKPRWYMVVQSLGGLTSITVDLTPARAI